MLTPGEGVVTRAGMAQLGSQGLEALNRGEGITVRVALSGIDEVQRRVTEATGALQEQIEGVSATGKDASSEVVNSFQEATSYIRKAGGVIQDSAGHTRVLGETTQDLGRDIKTAFDIPVGSVDALTGSVDVLEGNVENLVKANKAIAMSLDVSVWASWGRTVSDVIDTLRAKLELLAQAVVSMPTAGMSTTPSTSSSSGSTVVHGPTAPSTPTTPGPTRSTIPGPTRYFETGGLVPPDIEVPEYAQTGKLLRFVPKGGDTVPVMLTPGEGVVNNSGMQQLSPAGLAMLNERPKQFSNWMRQQQQQQEPQRQVINPYFDFRGSKVGNPQEAEELGRVAGEAFLDAVNKGGRLKDKFGDAVESAQRRRSRTRRTA
jgi:hypothetical protein